MNRVVLEKIAKPLGWYDNSPPNGDSSVIVGQDFLEEYTRALLSELDQVLDDYYHELDLHRAVVLLELRERVLDKLCKE